MIFKFRFGGFNGYKFYIFCKFVLKYWIEIKKKRNLEIINKLFFVLIVVSEIKEMEFCFLDNIELLKWIFGRVIDLFVIL